MSAWFASVCQALGMGQGPAFAVICIGVAVLLLTAIVLGFGPLRGWLGLAGPAPSARHRSGIEYEGLWGIWQLYRQLRRAKPLHK